MTLIKMYRLIWDHYMCLAIPSKIIDIKETIATIDAFGAQREVSLLLLPEEAKIGDFVLVHAGFAIQKVDREAGDEALKLINELMESDEFKESL